ncbi:MAG: hypothetical protein R3A52_01005 [Polyangiales bacterium]
MRATKVETVSKYAAPSRRAKNCAVEAAHERAIPSAMGRSRCSRPRRAARHAERAKTVPPTAVEAVARPKASQRKVSYTGPLWRPR